MTKQTPTDNPKILGLIPREHRLPALLFGTLQAVLTGIAFRAQDTVKIVALLGMFVIAGIFLLRFFPKNNGPEAKQIAQAPSRDEMFSESLAVARDILANSKTTDARLWSFTQTLLNGFKSQSRRFRDFQLIIKSGLNKEELIRMGLPFDLVLNGHLKMRMDDPYMIRTAYDASLIFVVIPDLISRESLSEFVTKAKAILSSGIDIPFKGHFDPWDTWVFVVGDKIDQNLKEMEIDELHQPYVNLFLFTFGGDAIRKCPHKWMDQVLQNFSLAWTKNL